MKHLLLFALLLGCLPTIDLPAGDDDDATTAGDDDDSAGLDLEYGCLTVALSAETTDVDTTGLYAHLLTSQVVISACDFGWSAHNATNATSFHWNLPDVTLSGDPSPLAADWEAEWASGFMFLEVAALTTLEYPTLLVGQLGGGHHLLTIYGHEDVPLDLQLDADGAPRLAPFTVPATVELAHLPDLADLGTISDQVTDTTALVTLTF